jgi:pyruvate kinase
MLTAFAALTAWSTQTIAQEKENGHKKTVVVHTGKVVSFDRGDPAMVVVKTEKADVNVELAPMSFIEQNKLTLAPDSAVSIRGYETTRDGKTVFVASEVTSGSNVIKLRDADFKPLWTVKSTAVEPQATTALVTRTGKVTTFTKGDPSVVVLETDKGAVTTELAPMTFIDENKVILAPNDMVTVRGFESVRDGKTYFVASDLTLPDRRIIRFRNEARDPVWVKTTETTTLRETDITDLNGTVTVIETTDTPDGRFMTI